MALHSTSPLSELNKQEKNIVSTKTPPRGLKRSLALLKEIQEEVYSSDLTATQAITEAKKELARLEKELGWTEAEISEKQQEIAYLEEKEKELGLAFADLENTTIRLEEIVTDIECGLHEYAVPLPIL